jgi:transcriptional regulator with XRE-family HTH domain
VKYDKNLFISNVYYLAKQRGVKIRDLESGCGVSVGYLARLRQEKKNTAPGADFLLAAAATLSVSLDALLTFDFSAATESESMLHDYLEKLIRETESQQLVWREDGFGYLDTLPVNPDGTTPHPLFDTLPDDAGTESVPFYFSRFRDLRGLIPVHTYGCVFPEGRTLYLVEVWNTGDDPSSPEDWTELELLMTGPGKYDSMPFCHTDHEKQTRLEPDLKRLFSVVSDAVSLPHLTQEALSYIDSYLKDS